MPTGRTLDRRTKTAAIPELTHAEVVRRLQRQIELIGSQTLAAQCWGVTQPTLSRAITKSRSIGPKLLKALKLRRVRLVVYRYESV